MPTAEDGRSFGKAATLLHIGSEAARSKAGCAASRNGQTAVTAITIRPNATRRKKGIKFFNA